MTLPPLEKQVEKLAIALECLHAAHDCLGSQQWFVQSSGAVQRSRLSDLHQRRIYRYRYSSSRPTVVLEFPPLSSSRR